MTDYWQWLRHADHQPRLMEMAYHHLLNIAISRPWVHVGQIEESLEKAVVRSSRMAKADWSKKQQDHADWSGLANANVFLDGNTLPLELFETLLDMLGPATDSMLLCGAGLFSNPSIREALLKRFPARLAILQSSVWWVQPEIPQPSLGARGAIFLPSFRDTRLVEENFAWRPELFEGLDLHVFDDNHEPAESERLLAIARACGWHYHASGMGRHSDLAHRQIDYSPYNGFIWRSLTSLADDYDYVVKLDTDTCLLAPDWWHEAAGRLAGRVAMLGTFELRPFYQVAPFWNTAWRNGWWRTVPALALGVQGGWYALSQEALRRIRDMGFMPGPHKDFTEDGYMSYSAQLLGIEMLASTTTGSWWRNMRPALAHVDHLKALHPLTRREWDEHGRDRQAMLADREAEQPV